MRVTFISSQGGRTAGAVLDLPNTSSDTGQVRDEPWSPPLVVLDRREPITALLLGWEFHEHSGEWHAWVMWIRDRRGESYRHIVAVPASGVRAVEPGEAYAQVPRRVRGRDGQVRPWTRALP